MSDDTLTSLIVEAIGRHLAPIIKWLYGVFAAVIAGTAFIVGMVHDVKQGIHDAAKDDNKLVLVALVTFGGAGRGANISRHIAAINSAMTSLGGNHQLTTQTP